MRRVAVLAMATFTCACAFAVAPAGATDANHKPPTVTLTAAGVEGLVGPRSEALAYFSTPMTFGPEGDPQAGYTPGSKVTFACTLDDRPIRCPAEYLPTEGGKGVFPSARPTGGKVNFLPSEFTGHVPVPEHLAPGPHTITVTATDEDGTDPAPPSVTVTLDRIPPDAPELTQVPPRRSWIRKPIFRFSASDDVLLVRDRDGPFQAALKRLDPPGLVYDENPFASYLSTWFPNCPTLLTCSTRAQAVYEASEGWYSYGEPERLIAGRYELRVRARDAVGNKSALSIYRFQVLRGKPR